MKPKIIIVVILSINSQWCLAQQADTSKAFELKSVTVTATRSEQDPMDVGRSITVISNKQIKTSGANTVAELLSQQAGIYIVGTGQNPGQWQYVFMRGANSNQTNILIDGTKISDPTTTDNAIDLTEISLADIDHIEIVRGSHSTLYGSSAIGGVINIITKKSQTPGVHTHAELKTGTFGPATSLFGEILELNYTLRNGLYFNAGLYKANVKGLNATVDTVTFSNDYKHNHTDKDNFTKTDLFGKLGYNHGNFDIFLSYKTIGQRTDLDKGAFNDDDNYYVKFKRNLAALTATYKINERFGLTYSGATTDLKNQDTDDSSKIDDSGNYDGAYYSGTYKARVYNQEIQVNFKMKGISGVMGSGLLDEKMTFSSYYYSDNYGIYESKQNLDSLKINVKTIDLFAHIDINGGLFNTKYNAFSIGIGARKTKQDLFGRNLSYEINPSLKLPNGGLLFASYSTGFNTPSLYQFYSPDKDVSSGISRGNQTLRPETSSSWEIGVKQKINNYIGYSISYFKTIVENSIDYVYLWDKSKNIDSLVYGDYRGDTYVNIGRQSNQGLEIAISLRMLNNLWINGNLSLISGKLEYSPTSIDTTHTRGNYIQLFNSGAFLSKAVEKTGLVRRPSTANLEFTYKPTVKLSTSVNLRYAGSRSDIYYSASSGPFGALAMKGIADYTLFDITTGYFISKSTSMTLRIENLFNLRYYEIYGYTTRGRGVYLSLRFDY
jgi:vitamin B12 transporter